MSSLRTIVGQHVPKFTLYRDGKKLTTEDNSYDLGDFIGGYEIYESIESASLEAKFIVVDAAGLINAFSGSETIKVDIQGTIKDRVYYFRIYQITARSRGTQSADIYILNGVSDEFCKNEVINVFGKSDRIFSGKTSSKDILTKLISGKKYLGSKKKTWGGVGDSGFEESLNKHSFVASNWRIFDTVYWLSQRSIRKKGSKKGVLQNGFAFFENGMGYNFVSIDKMIEDVNDQKLATDKHWENRSSQIQSTDGDVPLYEYEYSNKGLGDEGRDQFLIDKILFPDEKNYLVGLRHGAWAGFSIGFDPNNISRSKMGLSTDMSFDAYKYDIKSLWSKMSHIGGTQFTNPINKMDKDFQNYVNYPKRVRYTMLPNQIFDKKYKNAPQRNYEELVELQAYQWMRIESLKSIQIQISVPGNLDLYVGKGIKIVIPSTLKMGVRPIVDPKYSGRYVIGALTHQGDGTKLTTTMLLLRDSVDRSTLRETVTIQSAPDNDIGTNNDYLKQVLEGIADIEEGRERD